jgi:hypothetical protein
MKSILLSIAVVASASHTLSAATLALSLAQSAVGASGSTIVNLTTTGTMDWKVWTGDTGIGLTPNRAMSGGSGISSLATVGVVTNETANYPNTEFRFDYTNGTSPNVTNSSVLPADRIITDVNGEGTLLTVTLPAAGNYKLTYYTTTFAVNLQSLATLNNGGTPLTQTVNGTVPTGLQDYVWTVINPATKY